MERGQHLFMHSSKRQPVRNVFVMAVLAILLVPQIVYPCTHEYPDYDVMENHSLRSFPDASTAWDAIPAQITNFYNDRLPYKTALRSFLARANYALFHDSLSSEVVIGNDGYLFYDNPEDGDPIKDAQGIAQYSNEETQEMMFAIKENQTIADSIGASLYYFTIPNKENVCFQYLPDYYTKVNDVTRFAKLQKQLQANDIASYDCIKQLMTSDQQVYFKQDTHWNKRGAYVGTLAYLKAVHPQLDEAWLRNVSFDDGEEDYQITDLIRLSMLTNTLKDVKPVETFHPEMDVNWYALYDSTVIESVNDDAPLNETLLVVGDSFRNSMMPFLSKAYRRCFFVRRDNYYSAYLSWLDPDEIMMEGVERYAYDNFSFLLKDGGETYPLFQVESVDWGADVPETDQ